MSGTLEDRSGTLKEIPDYPSCFATEDGEIYSSKNGTMFKYSPAKAGKLGYRVVTLRNASGIRKRCSVSRLVLSAFRGPMPSSVHAAHFDGDVDNNALRNLRWATAKENAEDKRRQGRLPLGTKHYNAKLNNEDVVCIRLWHEMGFQYKQIARCYGVSVYPISCIVKRKWWKHVQ